MKLKRTGLILLLIALMPAVFYTAYEFSSLSETERLMKDIYEQQMNNVLFNINQSAWEITSRWVERFQDYLTVVKIVQQDSLVQIINSEPGIQCVFLTDSVFSDITFYVPDDTASSVTIGKKSVEVKLNNNRAEIDRMIYRKRVGYDKPVSVVINSGQSQMLAILYAYDKPGKKTGIMGLCINSAQFIETLPVTLDAMPQEEVEIGIFDDKTGKVIDRTGEITLKNAAATKEVWLFPNYRLAVKMSGVDLNQQVKRRFYSRLRWTLFLNSILIITIIILFRNIRMEMKLTRIKSDFVSNVSHELRTPLALIRMYAETLLLGRVRSDEKRNEYYTVITKESERLSHLVNKILDFSKMESGKKMYNFVGLDLNDVVRKVMEMYAFHLEQKKFTYQLKLSEKNLVISGDRQSISEAIINLLDNSMKYSDKVRDITIETGTDDQFHWISVSDKGEGIPGNDLSRIFDKFYRVSSALVHDTKGSGLGLALVDYIMKAHKGKITVKSKPGKGSTFRLNFPKLLKN